MTAPIVSIARRTAAITAMLAFASIPIGGRGAQAASLDLLRRATDPNPTLTTYTAAAQLSATLHVVIPVHKNVTGTVYYQKPKRKIEFQNLSGALARFKDLASQMPTYEEAMAQYTIAPGSDDGTVSTYTLTPKNTGSRVKSIVVSVNDARALVTHAHWTYTNRGSLAFAQTYENVGTFRLPAKADIGARFPGYSVDGTLTFTDYQPNVPIAPAVFAAPK